MRKIIFAVMLFSGLAAPKAFALDLNHPLPNWLGPNEHPSKAVTAPVKETVPPSGFRLPAEYEPASAVVIGWAAYTDMLTQIAKGVTGPGHADIWVAQGPDSIDGVPAEHYAKIDAPIDSVWARDYGPFGLKGDGTPGIVDATYRHYQERPSDDAFPANLGKAKNIPVYAMNMILDGGNIMVDSKGDLFMTKRTYKWNTSMSADQVDATLKKYFNVKNIYTFDYSGYPNDPSDGTGHIDMFMKLLNDHTVLISLADTEPYKSTGEKARAFFTNRTAPDGQPYKVITLKGWTASGAWYTYTNSLIINNVVLMPSYSGHDKDNAAAKAAYESGMSSVTVVPVTADQSIVDGGAIHCETQVIPMLPSASKNGTVPSVTTEPALSTDYPIKNTSSEPLEQLKALAK